ncbi:MAG: glycosyltransferase family 4 protein [Luteibaculaceae bacterium]
MKTLTQILFSGLGGHANVAFSLIEAQEKGAFNNQLIFYGIEALPEAYRSFCVESGVEFRVIKKRQGLDFGSWIEVYSALKQFKSQNILVHQTTLFLVCYFFSLLNRAKILTVEHTPNQVKTKLEWIFTALSFLFAPKVVLLTEAYRAELQQKWYFKPRKVEVIPNGINTHFFAMGRTKSLSTQLVISMIGRFATQKQQDKLMEAFTLVQQSYPNILLRLAGTGTEWERCKALAKDLQVDNKVHFEGMLNESQVRDLLQETHLYVHASTGETLSTAIIQAMSCGLPILASNIPGIAQMINEGENGILVNTNDTEVFAKAILALLENESLRKTLGEQARQTALEKYAAVNMLHAYLRALDF